MIIYGWEVKLNDIGTTAAEVAILLWETEAVH